MPFSPPSSKIQPLNRGQSVRESLEKSASCGFSYSKPPPTETPTRPPGLGGPRQTDARNLYAGYERNIGSGPCPLRPSRREDLAAVSFSAATDFAKNTVNVASGEH